MKNVLIITAHPDDHIFCSGLIFDLKEKGFKIKEIVLSEAELSGYVSKGKYMTNPNNKEKQNKRLIEYKSAIRKLGIDKFEIWKEPNLSIRYNKQLVLNLVKKIRLIKPIIVLTHSKVDYMRDHEKTSGIVLEAVRLASFSFKQDLGEPFVVPALLNFEGMCENNPMILIDITKNIDKKKKILSIYSSQILRNSWEVHRCIDRNLYLGSYLQQTGLRYAENYLIDKKWPLKISFEFLYKLGG